MHQEKMTKIKKYYYFEWSHQWACKVVAWADALANEKIAFLAAHVIGKFCIK
jgi:hypothetical protein